MNSDSLDLVAFARTFAWPHPGWSDTKLATQLADALEMLLKSRTEFESNQACNLLENTIIVQGGLRPCAPFFVPYLVKVLESELHESARLEVYDILTELAMGVASEHAHAQFSFRTSPFVHIIPDESSPPVFIELVTRLLLIQNVATYAKDIAYSSDAVRAAASTLLATFTGYAGLVRYVLSPYVNELPHSSATRSDICRLMNSLR